MVVVDALGKPCPIPVVEAKKALAQLPPSGGQVLVKVDNDVARQNLEKLAASAGAAFACAQAGEKEYHITLTAAESPAQAPAPQGGTPQGATVVAVGSDRMGEGSDELGRILIKGFLYTVGQMDPLPTKVLFYNSGALLTTRDSSALADLKAMEERGVEICTCGTCADYYQVKDQIAVGGIVNMYDIVSAMGSAARLLRP